MSEIKDRLREARRNKGLSQAGLSKLLGVSQAAIAAIESGRNKRPTNLASIAKALDISPYWLETGKEDNDGISNATPLSSEEMSRLEKVKELIENRFNGSQAEFARAIGKAPAQVNQWMNGYRNIGTGAAAHIEATLSLPRGWLDSKEEFRQPESNASILGTLAEWDNDTPLLPDDCEVPLYKEIHLSAGNGFSDDIADYNGYKLRFSKSTLRRHGINPADVVCVTADGDSMEPVFPSGATLGINTADKTIRDGQIYAINHGGLLRTKILHKLPENKVRIRSYNQSEYPDEEASLDDLSVIGRVFWWSVMV